MQVGMIGLGRMGANMVRRLLRGGHECVVHDVSPEAVHLHAWAVRFLRDQGIEVDVAGQDVIDQCWEEAVYASGTASGNTALRRPE